MSANSFKLTPIGDKLLVKAVSEEPVKVTIHIPEQYQGEPMIFEIIRIGTERPENKPWPVKVGDKIVLNQFVGSKIKVDGTEHRIINTDDILGVYRDA